MIVEVTYAVPQEQFLAQVEVESDATVEDAIKASGVLERFPQIDLAQNKVGIFSKVTSLDTVLRERDRVEIYRPLIADPKEVRRKKAEEKRKQS
ncbi:MAG: RnfH family protein [Gammaproteobacteria bacterium]|nr:RnfH family protein [Gammaproteobacteria bacterium]